MKLCSGLILIAMLLWGGVGCVGGVAQFVDQADGSGAHINYALLANGAKITASHATPGHEPETAFNGVVSSEEWSKGEGWEAEFEREHLKGGYTWMDSQARKEDHGGAWLEVRFPEPKKINRAVVYTVNNAQYPASRHGIREGALQVYWDYGWATVARVKNGKVEYPTTSLRYPAGHRIQFRFSPKTTDRIRFVVYRSNDHKIVGKEAFSNRRGGVSIGGSRVAIVKEKSTARIVEFEVTGFEFAAEDAEAQAPPVDGERSPNEVLTDDATSEANLASARSAATNPTRRIESVIRAYESAYSNRDLAALMSTISPDYSRGAENYDKLQARMAELFQRYTRIDIALRRLRIQPGPGPARIEADYEVALASTSGSPTTLSGKLFFAMSESMEGWRIVRIDTQRGVGNGK